MRIVSIGGGPAGLYFGILMKKAFPDTEIAIYERNRADDTFGWGVVFSDETLGHFEEADAESFAEIQSRFRYWRDIETYVGGQKIVSTGHGFCALSRQQLLLVLQQRCSELGVELHFEREVGPEEVGAADLVLGADGIYSEVRGRFAQHFGPDLDHRQCKFSWLGTDMPLDAFTFIFKQNEHGLFRVHAYPFAEGLATWIVECREETWRRAGLDQASEEQTVAYCEELFREDLAGHRLLSNRSLWRTFSTVRCRTWFGGPDDFSGDFNSHLLLMGDAAHTAHFSIGSGTKLAMEDAIELVQSFRELGTERIGEVLAHYQDQRWVDVIKLQKAAQTSLEWFENTERYMQQEPLQFAFNLMTRSKRITYDNLRQRDPELIRNVDRWYAERHDNVPPSGQSPPPPLFTPYSVRGLELANRVVVSPMCQYSAEEGLVHDWHLVHLGSRAVGGAGLVITEMTDICPEGRITPGCAGIWNDEQQAAWKRIVDFVHEHSPAKIGLQLAHAGRKGSAHHPWAGADRPLRADEGAWPTEAPSALPWDQGWPVPKAMNESDLLRVREAFCSSAKRARQAGFDLLELHMAHGYLLSSFLSPLANQRQDQYGGSLENRLRYPLEVLSAVREVWGEDRPLAVRISASDWMEDGSGTTPEEAVEVARRLCQAGCDLIDVSSGGNSPESKPVYGRMYQVPFAERIRHATGVPVMAVGAILGPDHGNTVLAAGRADLVAMARPHLRNPYLTLHAAAEYQVDTSPWPGQYLLGKPAPPKPD